MQSRKKKNIEGMWSSILGPLPIGTTAVFKDRRAKSGTITGTVEGYAEYYRYANKWHPKNFSYQIRVGPDVSWPYGHYLAWKRAITVIGVL